MKADLHIAEHKRLAALRDYEILDTPREAEFDDIVRVASAICDAPISVINLIDEGRQWFKAEVGLGVRETPLDTSICAHAILQPGLFVVPDTTVDRRFADNDLVTGDPKLRFYAGALLETPDGLPLGTVCVLDFKPRDLTETQRDFLKLMASQVMKLLQLRRVNAREHVARLHAEKLLLENQTLMRESDHRVMNSLQLVQSVLSLQSRNAESGDTKRELQTASDRVLAIAMVHKQLHLTGSLDTVSIGDFLRRLCDSLGQTSPANVSIKVINDEHDLRSDKASGLGLLTAELVTNSFKYAFPGKKAGKVTVTYRKNSPGWSLTVTDTGVGLPKGFDADRSNGVGMKVVGAIVRRLNATLNVSSSPEQTSFSIISAEQP